jgi:hypothetical protein
MQAQLKAWALEARLNKNGEKLEKAVVEALF